jgi:23S rRNA pseudouridine1911/1915/1917 synthase
MNPKGSNLKKRASAINNNQVFDVTEHTILMEFLIKQLPHKSRNNIKALLGYKQIFVDGRPVSQFNLPLAPGQKVELSGNRVAPEQKFKEYSILYEDQHLIVIDKAAGLLSMATENEKKATAYNLLSRHVKKQNRENKIFIVHRLDRETSGLMLFAKNEEIKERLQESWSDTILERTYIAVVEGVVKQPEGTLISYLWEDKNYTMHSTNVPGKGQKAITRFEVIRQNESYSLLKINLETGRKNQIRIHMQEMGHSIAGDKKYGAATSPLKRLGLHAQQLSFIHPETGKEMKFETKIPKAFMRIF